MGSFLLHDKIFWYYTMLLLLEQQFLALAHGSFIEYYKMITRDKREPQARKPH